MERLLNGLKTARLRPDSFIPFRLRSASFAFADEQPLGRSLRKVRPKTRAVGALPDGKSALMLAAAPCGRSQRGTRRYVDMDRLAQAGEDA
jgi:hypothetical protein